MRDQEERERAEDLAKTAMYYAKRRQLGLPLNIVYDLDDGRHIKVKKVQETQGTFWGMQVRRPGETPPVFVLGEVLSTAPADNGQKMQLIKKQGRKWKVKILGTS